jgi:hypothetical protein
MSYDSNAIYYEGVLNTVSYSNIYENYKLFTTNSYHLSFNDYSSGASYYELECSFDKPAD